MVKVPIIELKKPPKKLINNPDLVIICSWFISFLISGASTTFKR